MISPIDLNIHGEKNEVKTAMNGFVLASGNNLGSLTDQAKKAATTIGEFEAKQGDTACQTPNALASVEKVKKIW